MKKPGRKLKYANDSYPRPCKTVGCENDRAYYTSLCRECHVRSKEFKRDKRKRQPLFWKSGLKI